MNGNGRQQNKHKGIIMLCSPLGYKLSSCHLRWETSMSHSWMWQPSWRSKTHHNQPVFHSGQLTRLLWCRCLRHNHQQCMSHSTPLHCQLPRWRWSPSHYDPTICMMSGVHSPRFLFSHSESLSLPSVPPSLPLSISLPLSLKGASWWLDYKHTLLSLGSFQLFLHEHGNGWNKATSPMPHHYSNTTTCYMYMHFKNICAREATHGWRGVKVSTHIQQQV